ncbi:GP88 family protein [Paenibacillus sp. Soil724D2]|uniref:GP88 family protein n=1 Tax=Paenibacillus sp. (strain Soil724D2) TaxID=1736392 RepID=UPI000713454B|nr:hypothetical protein [Paenibacillus sp. Soil724D2]KRE33417.1 hypothetical protein ASG85_14200 [Paenibacillus sp. Soil724D2]
MRYNTKVKAIQAGVAKSKVKMGDINIGVSINNAKLVETEFTRFLIWSITSVKTCPLATPMCIKSCYATKAERIYPSVRTRRETNYEASQQESFIPDMIELIQYELDQTDKNINFRIHESGDFYTYEYAKKWNFIALHFIGNSRITFMAYTKSLPFVQRLYAEFGKHWVNIKFMASVWEDTTPAMIKLGNKLGLNTFTALTTDQFQLKDYSSYFKCPSTASIDAYGCGTCSEKHGSCYRGKVNIAIEIH